MHAAILALLLTACTSCAILRPAGQSPVEQHNASVVIEVTCPNNRVVHGSGVLVSEDRVLTAQHVVACRLDPLVPLYQDPVSIRVYADKLGGASAVVELEVPRLDVARLRLADQSLASYFTSVRVGPPPTVGERVCVVNSWPLSMYRCGEAQVVNSGKVGFSIMTEYGNSGSPVYDDAGRLVAILTNLVRCQADIPCGGYGTALAGLSWLVPE